MLIEKSSSKQSLFSLVIVTCRLCDEKIWTLTKAWEAFGYSNGLLLGQFQFGTEFCGLGSWDPSLPLTQPKLYLNSFLNGRLLKIDMNIGPLASTKLFVVKNDLFWLTPMLETNKLAFGSSIASNPEQKRRQT